MISLGAKAPDFDLADPAGDRYTLSSFADAKALLMVVMCNHCPYVIHLADRLAELAKQYQAKGAAVIGINANDVANYPDDSPAKMAEEIKKRGYPFPYLYDETQELAKALCAACTPEFYVFDADQRLVYHGQFDDTRPGQGEPTGADVAAALDAVLAGEAVSADQKPSAGCSVKWIAGNEPTYA